MEVEIKSKIDKIELGDLVAYEGKMNALRLVVQKHNSYVSLISLKDFQNYADFSSLEELNNSKNYKLIAKSEDIKLIVG